MRTGSSVVPAKSSIEVYFDRRCAEVNSGFHSAGSAGEWKAAISLCKGSSRAIASLAHAFTGPVCAAFGYEPPGLQLACAGGGRAKTLLAKTVGLVPQKPYLFTGTVATNLRYGNPDATDEELWAALETAQAKDFVQALAEGLDAPIAQGGTNVSGGQRQRLAIARVLVRRPEIYLFDDSFSALDYATDARLRAALARETADATVVIVAQRVSTIRDADRIIVLDEGSVVGTGTHHEWMDTNETYREIVLSQLTEAEAA